MLYEDCAWQQRLVCVSFLVTKLTRDYVSNKRLLEKSPFSLHSLLVCWIWHNTFICWHQQNLSACFVFKTLLQGQTPSWCKSELQHTQGSHSQGVGPETQTQPSHASATTGLFPRVVLQTIPLKWLWHPFIPAQCLSGSHNAFHLHDFNGYMFGFFLSLDIF